MTGAVAGAVGVAVLDGSDMMRFGPAEGPDTPVIGSIAKNLSAFAAGTVFAHRSSSQTRHSPIELFGLTNCAGWPWVMPEIQGMLQA